MQVSRFNILVFIFFCTIGTFILFPDASYARKAFSISPQQSQLLHESFLHAKRANFDKSIELIEKSGNPVLVDMMYWHHYVTPNNHSSFSTIIDFIRRQPNWPRQNQLRRNAELSLRFSDSPKLIISWFNQHPPLTSRGKWFLANAYIKESWYSHSDPRVTKLIREAWTDGNFSSKDEKAFLKEHKSVLTHQDHIHRINRLLWDERVTQAKRILSYVNSDYRALFTARIYLIRNRRGVDRFIHAVPDYLQKDIGLAFDRVKWRQRKKRYDDALSLFLELDLPEAYGDKAWPIIKRQMRILIRKQDYKKAYTLISNHKQTKPTAYAEAEWLAGWIALRKLQYPQQAVIHFKQLYESVSYPISVARASYWLGRSYSALEKHDAAHKWYQEASRYSNTFYGQLAASIVTKDGFSRLPPLPYVSSDDFNYTNYNPLLHAAYFWHHLDEQGYSHSFIRAAVNQAPTHGQLALASKFSISHLNNYELAVKAASKALRRGVFIVDSLYPTIKLPNELPVTATLALSVIRQESHFDATARSSSGAVGLMQLMPATARLVSRRLNLRYSSRRLERDHFYNITLGTHYLEQLLELNDYSLPLTLASYNAGPGNVKKWLDVYGDYSRLKTLEERIDWIESIPFAETRNYVQRVLESHTIYRALLHQDKRIHNHELIAILMK